MRIKTIAVEYKRKFNLGDFNSAELACHLWADVSEDESEEAALKQLSVIARENVKERALPLLGNLSNENFKQMFQGLPVELQEVAKRSGYNGD